MMKFIPVSCRNVKKINALKWPPKKDEIWVNLEKLLCVVEAPVKNKRMFHIPDLILDNIVVKFQEYLATHK